MKLIKKTLEAKSAKGFYEMKWSLEHGRNQDRVFKNIENRSHEKREALRKANRPVSLDRHRARELFPKPSNPVQDAYDKSSDDTSMQDISNGVAQMKI